jgi:hypothetical protein
MRQGPHQLAQNSTMMGELEGIRTASPLMIVRPPASRILFSDLAPKSGINLMIARARGCVLWLGFACKQKSQITIGALTDDGARLPYERHFSQGYLV